MSAKKQINIQELIRLKSKKAGDEAGREALILEDVHNVWRVIREKLINI